MSLFIPFLLGRIHFFKKITWLYATLGIGLLSTVLILGEVTHGSKISFTMGGITFQPSEFVKILFLFFLAGALWENVSFQRVLLTAVIAGAHVVVLVVSKDLGSALIFFIGFVFVVFAATKNYLYLAAGMIGGGAASYLAYLLFDHVRVRVLAWQDPWKYIDSKGYQITQSLFAIGSGSWFGMGLLRGNPTAIPYVEADFLIRQGITLLTVPDIGSGLDHDIRQSVHTVLRHIDQVKSQSLCGLTANPRKGCQFFY
jgi:cell division protein FtsW (lipid II flippase)